MRFFRKIQILIFEKVIFFFSERTPAIFAQGAISAELKILKKKKLCILDFYIILYKVLYKIL